LGRPEEHPNNEVELTKEDIEIKKFKEVSKRMCKSVVDKKKLSFTKEDLNYFEAADLCQICYVNRLDINVKAEFECGHIFCKNCLNSYLVYCIHNGRVTYN
jgi:hypothetical protein